MVMRAVFRHWKSRLLFFWIRYLEAEPGPICRRNQEGDFGHNIRKEVYKSGNCADGKAW